MFVQSMLFNPRYVLTIIDISMVIIILSKHIALCLLPVQYTPQGYLFIISVKRRPLPNQRLFHFIRCSFNRSLNWFNVHHVLCNMRNTIPHAFIWHHINVHKVIGSTYGLYGIMRSQHDQYIELGILPIPYITWHMYGFLCDRFSSSIFTSDFIYDNILLALYIKFQYQLGKVGDPQQVTTH